MTQKLTEKINQIILESLALTHDAVGIFDPDDRLVYCNDEMATFFGLPVEEALNKTFAELSEISFNSEKGINIEFDSLSSWLFYVLSKRRSLPFRSFETDTTDGKWFLVTEQVVHDGYLFSHATDITEKKESEKALKRMAEELKEMATTDYLTGVYNRRYFYEKAKEELNRLQRKNQPVSIMVFDLDNFKCINDKVGHAGGDEVLKSFANTVQLYLRNYDTFARVGGDEFAVLLPNTTNQDAHLIAERIRLAIQSLTVPFEKHILSITVSIGITEHLSGSKTIDELMNAADKCLYQTKGSGRNQVS